MEDVFLDMTDGKEVFCNAKFTIRIYQIKRRSFLLSLIAIVAVGLIWSGVVIKYELPKTHEAYNAIYTMTYLNDVILPLHCSFSV